MKRFIEFITEKNEIVSIDVYNKDDLFIDKLIDKFTLVYKKRKDRHTRPISIKGNTSNDFIKIKIVLSNKDVIDFEYDNVDLKIIINGKLLYHDDVLKDDILNKIHKVYTTYLSKQNFKFQKETPFDNE